MQSFIVVASLVSELAGGQNETPLSPQRYKKHFKGKYDHMPSQPQFYTAV